jgi:predicted RNA-binding Zn-ribbon protein involved in translation (DUF1610 family)
MDATYQCLSCGQALTEAEVGSNANVAPCPKCGRDMYRQEPARASVPSRYGASAPAVGGGPGPGVTRSAPAIPSRYGGTPGAEQFTRQEEDEDLNPALVPHTPFVVILGLIFSFLPLACFAGVIISFLGYRLVKESPKGIRGKEMAIAGMIIGGVMSALTVYLMAMRDR